MCHWLSQLSGTPCILSYCTLKYLFFLEFDNKYDLTDFNGKKARGSDMGMAMGVKS